MPKTLKRPVDKDLHKMALLQQAQVQRVVDRVGVRRTLTLHEDARKKLGAEIRDLARANRIDSFAIHHRRVLLSQIERSIADLTARMESELAGVTRQVLPLGVVHADAEIARLARLKGYGADMPLATRPATHLLGVEGGAPKTLLRMSADEKARAIRSMTAQAEEIAVYRGSISIKRYGLDLIDTIERRMSLGLLTGETVDDMTTALAGPEGVLAGERYRAERIVRTELANAYGFTRHQTLLDAARDVPMKRQWISIADDRRCERCEDMHGEVRAMDEPFKHGGDDVMTPPAHPHCMLPGTRVRGQYVAGLKTRYSGPAVRIKTASGNALAVTPNHPILTMRGKVAAGSLDKGDDVFRYARHVEDVPGWRGDHEQGPSPVEDIFEALSQQGLSTVEIGRLDLHGDAAATNGYVEIVGTDGQSANRIEATRLEQLHQFVFVLAAMQEAIICRFGSREFGFKRHRATALGYPSRRALPLYRLAILLQCFPFDRFRFGLRAETNTRLLESVDKNDPLDASVVGQMLHGLPGIVARDEIVEVGDFNFSGHVYDLQSGSGLIVAENTVISNCRCVTVPYLPGVDE